MSSRYIGKWNKWGQCIVVPLATAHLPHIDVHYWDGGMYCSLTLPVLPGQTQEQAAGKYAHRARFSASSVELFDECPSSAAICDAQSSAGFRR